MKQLKTLFVFLLLSFTAFSHAAMITNGDFQTCDFSGWQKDTDGFGDPGATGDFSITDVAGECSANISVDIFAGATAFFANTLFTSLDLTGLPEQDLLLSFDWSFSGFDDESLDADLFFVGLGEGSGTLFGADGGIGFLISPTSIYGSGTFNTALDSSFLNQSGWTLEFAVQGGFTPDSLSSSLNIDNVSLVAVNEPPATAFFAATLIMMCCFRQQRPFRS